jgi:hypothetical protein
VEQVATKACPYLTGKRPNTVAAVSIKLVCDALNDPKFEKGMRHCAIVSSHHEHNDGGDRGIALTVMAFHRKISLVQQESPPRRCEVASSSCNLCRSVSFFQKTCWPLHRRVYLPQAPMPFRPLQVRAAAPEAMEVLERLLQQPPTALHRLECALTCRKHSRLVMS